VFQEFYDAGAEGYDLLFGRVPRHFPHRGCAQRN
jgi:hypothetical protein